MSVLVRYKTAASPLNPPLDQFVEGYDVEELFDLSPSLAALNPFGYEASLLHCQSCLRTWETLV